MNYKFTCQHLLNACKYSRFTMLEDKIQKFIKIMSRKNVLLYKNNNTKLHACKYIIKQNLSCYNAQLLY